MAQIEPALRFERGGCVRGWDAPALPADLPCHARAVTDCHEPSENGFALSGGHIKDGESVPAPHAVLGTRLTLPPAREMEKRSSGHGLALSFLE